MMIKAIKNLISIKILQEIIMCKRRLQNKNILFRSPNLRSILNLNHEKEFEQNVEYDLNKRSVSPYRPKDNMSLIF